MNIGDGGKTAKENCSKLRQELEEEKQYKKMQIIYVEDSEAWK